jgi:small multidrug resistance family-3 protein
MSKEMILKSIAGFVAAGICEIGGGYMVWKAIKSDQPIWVGIFGGILLVAYGIIATMQPTGFGRTYAVYGGVFIIMSLLWGWLFDKMRPDVYDMAGAFIVLVGVALIFYAPRK